MVTSMMGKYSMFLSPTRLETGKGLGGCHGGRRAGKWGRRYLYLVETESRNGYLLVCTIPCSAVKQPCSP